ncbi:MAG: zf-HC2 domain-containing protein, partial [Terrabacter sp.]
MNDDVHALSGAYAFDAIDDIERARFERHLAGCSECQAEVASLRAAASEMAVLSEVAPPPSLRAKVLAEISTVRP